MEELINYYRQGLTARIDALQAAQRGLNANSEEAVESIRRIAHSLRGSGATYGFPEITEAATCLEAATASELPERLETLLNVLRKTAKAEDSAKAAILIIEDDPDISHLLKIKLSAPNREILIAETTKEAERILEKRTVSLILLDLVLPDMDGRNLLLRLRERPRTATTPIFILSGKVGEQTKTECFALGADEFFNKPFDPATISAAVGSRLQRGGEQQREFRLDPITGRLSRAAFREQFETTPAQAREANEVVAIAVIDLDAFETIRDKHGIEIGDQILRHTGDILARCLRPTDLLARWIGGEFVALFPNCDPKRAAARVEKALRILREKTFSGAKGEPLRVTFSAGITEAPEGVGVEEAVANAGGYLFQAKTAGRNRVLSSQDDFIPPKKKILLADDDELIAAVIRHRLEREGFEMVHCLDGRAAYAAAETNSFSLAVLDYKMPIMDGFELLERLRKHPAYAKIPIVMLTSMGNEKDIVRGFALGADEYILKPFSPVELLARIHRLLRKT